MTLKTAGLVAVLALLTLGGFFFFPGHTFLQSDTQIYIPILERLWDHSVFGKDPVATRPHVSYTIYDEMALLFRRVTGQPFQVALHAQQMVYRFCGLVGMYLIGTSLGLSWRMALLLASIFGLGATVNGPAVLTLEYEPVPRGYAIPLIVLGIGLLAHRRFLWAGVACGVAYLYHPPSIVPFLAMLTLYTVWRRNFRPWLPIVTAMFLGWVFSQFQPGESEPQRFFTHIDPTLEAMQRLRGAYNWVSLWPVQFIRHYEFLLPVCLVALWRLRARVPEPLKLFFLGLPIYGVLAVAASYALLEGAKWAFIPQFQPARAVLWVSFVAITLGATAGIYAAKEGRWAEAFAWLVLVFCIPQQADVLQLLFPDVREYEQRTRFLVAVVLAAIAYAAARWEFLKPAASRVAWAAVLAFPFYLIPEVGKVRNYPPLHHPEIHELADWAQTNTKKDDLFLFPDAGRELFPGLFRVYALRPLYVDWKGGGQVNLLREFGYQWWERWNKTAGEVYDPAKLNGLRGYGIDYVVLKQAHRVRDREPIHENSRYVVYRTW
ncbi:MAG: hypothetical protein IT168_03865 [Bryobacterales bacterium]|nr:hypothetical protein [Bryobacterales bacterium]